MISARAAIFSPLESSVLVSVIDGMYMLSMMVSPASARRTSLASTQKVRLAAKSLLHRLLSEPPPVLIQDWFKDSQSKERVKSTVQEVLNVHLPESYDRALFTKKCDTVFELMLNYASQGLKWAA